MFTHTHTSEKQKNLRLWKILMIFIEMCSCIELSWENVPLWKQELQFVISQWPSPLCLAQEVPPLLCWKPSKSIEKTLGSVFQRRVRVVWKFVLFYVSRISDFLSTGTELNESWKRACVIYGTRRLMLTFWSFSSQWSRVKKYFFKSIWHFAPLINSII